MYNFIIMKNEKLELLLNKVVAFDQPNVCYYKGNRNGEKFLCLNCGHADNADINAGKNILNRFLTGQNGARYKQENQENLVITNFL